MAVVGTPVACRRARPSTAPFVSRPGDQRSGSPRPRTGGASRGLEREGRHEAAAPLRRSARPGPSHAMVHPVELARRVAAPPRADKGELAVPAHRRRNAGPARRGARRGGSWRLPGPEGGSGRGPCRPAGGEARDRLGRAARVVRVAAPRRGHRRWRRPIGAKSRCGSTKDRSATKPSEPRPEPPPQALLAADGAFRRTWSTSSNGRRDENELRSCRPGWPRPAPPSSPTGTRRGAPAGAAGDGGARRRGGTRAAGPDLLPDGALEAGHRRARGLPSSDGLGRRAPGAGRLVSRPEAVESGERTLGGVAGRLAFGGVGDGGPDRDRRVRWPTEAAWPRRSR